MQNWTDIYFTARDGLRLHARHYPVPGSLRRPLVCLAGLTRNSRDFHDLASVLSRPDETGRDVYAIDYRGRGRSQYDPDWKHYSILTELNDVLDFMTMRGLQPRGPARHLARRAHHHADGRAAADGDRRRHPQRHRPRDRARRPRPHHRLCRAGSAADRLGGGHRAWCSR